MEDKIFHTTDVMPEYDTQLLVQHENGSYNQFFYWAFPAKYLQNYFNKNDPLKGKVIRWCYISDLNKIK